MIHHLHVLIIGAGAAGIYAAHLLEQAGIHTTIVEASHRYGGRLLPVHGFAHFPVEVGAEEIIGTNTEWYRIVCDSQKPLVTLPRQNYYFIDGQLYSESEIEDDPDLNRAWEFQENLKHYRGEDITVKAYIDQLAIPQRVYHIVNAETASEWGGDESKMGMRGLAEAERRYDTEGEGSFLKDNSLLSVLEDQFPDIIKKIKLNTRICRIDYSKSKIEVTDETGNVFVTDKVIVTVPVSILKDNDITFHPPLPAEKQDALRHIGMDNIAKIILKFNERFWPEDAGFIYNTGRVDVFWSPSTGRSQADHLLTGFVSGRHADYCSQSPGNGLEIANEAIQAMYGSKVMNFKEACYIKNWIDEPFIRGGYSYQLVGSEGCRDVLARPISDRIYFAGEATSTTGNFGSVHGAIETAVKAVAALVKG